VAPAVDAVPPADPVAPPAVEPPAPPLVALVAAPPAEPAVLLVAVPCVLPVGPVAEEMTEPEVCPGPVGFDPIGPP
jgi:hypothetical protein